MGKRKPKPVQHKLPGFKFLFLPRKYLSPLLPPLSLSFPLRVVHIHARFLAMPKLMQAWFWSSGLTKTFYKLCRDDF